MGLQAYACRLSLFIRKMLSKVTPLNNYNKLEKFGFSYGRGGVHSARTMMLAEMQALMAYVDKTEAPKTEYLDAIQVANCLGKRSGKTRILTYRHLIELYTLDPNYVLFRALRFFWQRDVAGQPLLAALCAYTRDPIFRSTATFILGFPEGSTVTRNAVEELIDLQEPGRFSEATLKSTAQNINSSWTQAGHLAGRARKVRVRAVPTPGAVAFALLLAYLNGARGESLFNNEYMQLLDCNFTHAIELAEDASRRGWITLKRVGQVIEVLFPTLINAQEMDWLREQN